jgi:hypothetical protein
MTMTQLIHEPLIAVSTEPPARPATGVVFVPCAVCRGPVDLGAVTDANDAPICGKHFVTEWPPLG